MTMRNTRGVRAAPENATRFHELTAPLMAKIKTNSTESCPIATLLLRLLGGELSVAEVKTSR